MLPTGLFFKRRNSRRWPDCFQGTRTNDSKLKTHLTLVATNLDSGEAVPLDARTGPYSDFTGCSGQLSALPGCLPVEIETATMSTVLIKTMHLMALDDGVERCCVCNQISLLGDG
jgi:hypothetical protein